MASIQYDSGSDGPPAKKSKMETSGDSDQVSSKRKKPKKPAPAADPAPAEKKEKSSRPKREMLYTWPSASVLAHCKQQAIFKDEVTVDQVYRRDRNVPENWVDKAGRYFAALCGDRTTNKDRHPLCNRCMYMRGWEPCTANNDCDACTAMRGCDPGAFHAWHTSNYRRGPGWSSYKGNVKDLTEADQLQRMPVPTYEEIKLGLTRRKTARSKQVKDEQRNPLLAGSVIYYKRSENRATSFPAMNPLLHPTVVTTMSSITLASTAAISSSTTTTSTFGQTVKTSASRTASAVSSRASSQSPTSIFMPGFTIPKLYKPTARMSTSAPSATKESNIKRKSKPVPAKLKPSHRLPARRQAKPPQRYDEKAVVDLAAQVAAIEQAEDDRIASTHIPPPVAVLNMDDLMAASSQPGKDVHILDHQYVLTGAEMDQTFSLQASMMDTGLTGFEDLADIDQVSTVSSPNVFEPHKKVKRGKKSSKSITKSQRLTNKRQIEEERTSSPSVTASKSATTRAHSSKQPKMVVSPASLNAPAGTIVLSGITLDELLNSPTKNRSIMSDTRRRVTGRTLQNFGDEAMTTLKMEIDLQESQVAAGELYIVVGGSQEDIERWFYLKRGLEIKRYDWYHYAYYLIKVAAKKLSTKPSGSVLKSAAFVFANEFERQATSRDLLGRRCHAMKMDETRRDQFVMSLPPDTPTMGSPSPSQLTTNVEDILRYQTKFEAAEDEAERIAKQTLSKSDRRKQQSPAKSPHVSHAASDLDVEDGSHKKSVTTATVTTTATTVTTATTSVTAAHVDDLDIANVTTDDISAMQSDSSKIISSSLVICTASFNLPKSLSQVATPAKQLLTPDVTQVFTSPLSHTRVTPQQTPVKHEAPPSADLISTLFNVTPGLVSLDASDVDNIITTATGTTVTTPVSKQPELSLQVDNENPFLDISLSTGLSLLPDVDLFHTPVKQADLTLSLNTPEVSVVGNVTTSTPPRLTTSSAAVSADTTPQRPVKKSLKEVTKKLESSFDVNASGDGLQIGPITKSVSAADKIISSTVATSTLSSVSTPAVSVTTTASVSVSSAMSVTTQSNLNVTTQPVASTISFPAVSISTQSSTALTMTAPGTSSTTSNKVPVPTPVYLRSLNSSPTDDQVKWFPTVGLSSTADYQRHDISYLAECLGFKDLLIPATTTPVMGHILTNAESNANLSAPTTLNITSDIQHIVAERIGRQREHMEAERAAGRDFTAPIRPDESLTQFALHYHSELSALPIKAMAITTGLLPSGVPIAVDSPFLAAAAECEHVEECARILLNINNIRSLFLAALAQSQLRGKYGDSDQRAITKVLAMLSSDSTRVTTELLVFTATMRRRANAKALGLSGDELLEFISAPILYNLGQ